MAVGSQLVGPIASIRAGAGPPRILNNWVNNTIHQNVQLYKALHS